MPLLGAYMADEHWGRYKTIAIAIAVALVGHAILIVSAIPHVITHPTASVACFAVGLVIMGVGVGGFKSNISPLIAEQYKQITLEVRTLPSGERVVLDPTLTVSRIYMYFYMMINIGALCGSVSMVYAEVCLPPSPCPRQLDLDLVRRGRPADVAGRNTSGSGCRSHYRPSCSSSAPWSWLPAATATSAARPRAALRPRRGRSG